MITINFESPPGTPVQTTRFAPGASVHIYGNASGSYDQVRLDLFGDEFDPIVTWDAAGLRSEYDFYVVLPEVDSAGIVRITTYTRLFSFRNSREVPIGIGNVRPPPPEPEDTDFLGLGSLSKALLYGGVALGVGLLAVSLARRK